LLPVSGTIKPSVAKTYESALCVHRFARSKVRHRLEDTVALPRDTGLLFHVLRQKVGQRLVAVEAPGNIPNA
jgi:hypothetical protein